MIGPRSRSTCEWIDFKEFHLISQPCTELLLGLKSMVATPGRILVVSLRYFIIVVDVVSELPSLTQCPTQ